MLRVLGVAFGLCLATVSWAGEAKLFLSWNRPYGLPGASQALTRACVDSNRVDTLYMSFQPGKACPSCTLLVGLTATLTFKAPQGDTLSPLWRPGRDNTLPPWLWIEWAPDSTSGRASPWSARGYGFTGYVQAEGYVKLGMVYAVSIPNSVPVKEGQRYSLARLMLRSFPPGNPDCFQPVTIEWARASLGYDLNEVIAEAQQEARVSLNSPWLRQIPRSSTGGTKPSSRPSQDGRR